jgi:putative transposase
MSNTYTQLYIQLVFAVKGRKNFIHPEWEDELQKYITAIVQTDKHKMLSINGMPDHIHIFIGLNPAIAISDVVKDIKRASSGYGAFSYSRSHIERVCNYIANQKEHQAKRSFKEEYIRTLKLFNIPFKDEYLFEFYE